MTNAPVGMIRAFIAINLPHQIKAELETFQRTLKVKVPTDWVRWTVPDQIHITLRFLGNIPAESMPELEAAVQRACMHTRPFELAAERFGWFPEGNQPRVLWVGVSGQLDSLSKLAEAVTTETMNWGELEDREFRAHMTIGRVKTRVTADLRKLAQMLANIRLGKVGQWQVTHVDLMQSQLYSTGPVYTCIATVPLGG